jgi:hypothetical protein
MGLDPIQRLIDHLLRVPPKVGTTCATDERLSQYLKGQLSGAEFQEVDRHLAGCEDCLQRAERIAEEIESQRRAAEREAEAARRQGARARGRRLPMVIMAVTCGLLLGVVGFTSSAAWYWHQRLGRLREHYHVDRPIRFSYHDSPVMVIGQRVHVSGEAYPHIIKELRVTVTPGLDSSSGQPFSVTLPITGSDANVVPEFPSEFSWWFEAPRDGCYRTIRIEAIPHSQARAAAPADLHPDKLTTTVGLSCTAAGPIAYVDELVRLENLTHGQLVEPGTLNVKGTAAADGLICVFVQDTENQYHLQGPPVRVEAGRLFNQVIHFGVPAKYKEDEFFVVHIGFFSSLDLWPSHVPTVTAGLPQSANPRLGQIIYSSVPVKVKVK